MLRFCADTFFANRYGHRAVVLETIAAVPGIVGATLRDVVLVVRADEAHHRDVNHGFASTLAGAPVDEMSMAPYPAHAADLRRLT